MPTRLIIVGAGGHASVVAAAAKCAGYAEIRIVDQNVGSGRISVTGIDVESFDKYYEHDGDQYAWHIGIGDAAARARISEQLSLKDRMLETIVHPSAICDSTAVVDGGCFNAAQSVVAAGAKVEQNCIINHGAIVDHECHLGSESHVAPGAVLGGNVSIGRSCLIGANAVVLPGTRIGDGCMIGAGAVVTRDIGSGSTVVGNPAKVIKP